MPKRRADDDEELDPPFNPSVGIIVQLNDKPARPLPAYPIGFIVNDDMRRQWRKADRARKRKR